MTAPVWQRGIMEEHYDLPQPSMTWVTGAVEPSATERKEKIVLDLPSNLSVTPIGPGKCLSQVASDFLLLSACRLSTTIHFLSTRCLPMARSMRCFLRAFLPLIEREWIHLIDDA
jgi:hypothetical protein